MLLLIALLLYIPAAILGLIWIAKETGQKLKDRKRKTYRLSFPGDLSPEQVIKSLNSLSGTLRGSPWRWKAPPTVALEVFATNRGIVHRLKVPFGYVGYIIPQLRLAGIEPTLEEEFEDRNWVRGVELGLSNTGRQLRISDPDEVSARILACLQSLKPDEAIIIQFVLTPAAPTAPPIQGEAQSLDFGLGLLRGTEANNDEVQERRRKLEQANFLAVMRVAAAARSESGAQHLVDRIKQATASTRSPHVRFTRRWVSMSAQRGRIRAAGTPTMNFPMQLSVTELAALTAWPMGRPMIAGLAPTLARPFPAPASVPQDGRPLGNSAFPGSERPIAVDYDRCCEHFYILGPSGKGKSTHMNNMMVEDMNRGYGVFLIESKGDLARMALDTIPSHRMKDLIYIDLAERRYPVGFNILDQGNDRTAIDNIIGLISTIYADAGRSITAPQMIYHMLHALAEVPGHTFIDLPALMMNHPADSDLGRWQEWVTRNVKRKEIREYLQRYENMKLAERDRLAAPVYNRTWEFTNRDEIKYILGQRRSSFRMTDAIRDNKIIIVNLRSEMVGDQTASLVGSLLVNSIWQAVRQVTPDRPNFLYLDEFADFVKLPVGVEAMLSKARSAKLGLVMAHQELGQLSPQLRASVLANTATKIFFQLPAADAAAIAREMGGLVKADDLINLGRHETIVRAAVAGGSSPPLTVKTPPPARSTGNAEKAWLLSQETYGRPLEDVEKDLDTRPGGGGERPRRRPRVSGEGWI